MGRIIVSVEVADCAADGGTPSRVDALVDKRVNHFVVPLSWRNRFPEFVRTRKAEMQFANFAPLRGVMCAPAEVRVENFMKIFCEIYFADIAEEIPLLGRTVLAASGAEAKDGRLVKSKYDIAWEIERMKWKAALRRAGI